MGQLAKILNALARGIGRLWSYWINDVRNRKSFAGKAASAGIGLFAICCVCSVGVGAINSAGQAVGIVPTSTPRPSPTVTVLPTTAPTLGPTNTPEPTRSPEPTATPGPTNTPEPPPSPAEIVRGAITQALLKGNRDVERVITVAIDPDVKDPAIYIRWSINDNLTEGLVKLGAQVDLKNMLKAIHDSDVQYSLITADGLFPLVDTFGNTKETIVVHAVYKRETVDRINWENFLTKNIYQIADEVNIHPVFRP